MSSVSIHALWQSNWFTCEQGKSQPPPSPWHPASVTLTSSDWNLLTVPMNMWKLPPKIPIGLSLVSFLSTGKAKLLITFHFRQVSSVFPASSLWVVFLAAKSFVMDSSRYYGLISELSRCSENKPLSFQSSFMLSLLPELIQLHLCLPHSSRSRSRDMFPRKPSLWSS